MKVQVIEFTFTVKDDDAHRGYQEYDETKRALFITTQNPTDKDVLVVRHLGETHFFTVARGRRGSRMRYAPVPTFPLSEILPKKRTFRIIEEAPQSGYDYDAVCLAELIAAHLHRFLSVREYFSKLLVRADRGESLAVPKGQSVI